MPWQPSPDILIIIRIKVRIRLRDRRTEEECWKSPSVAFTDFAGAASRLGTQAIGSMGRGIRDTGSHSAIKLKVGLGGST